MDRGTYFGHVAEHVALELSSLAGREVCLGRTLWAGADGHYDVVLECPPDEAATSPVPARLLDAAIEITEDLRGRPGPGRGRATGLDHRFCGNRVSSGSVPPPSPRPPGAGAYRSAGSAATSMLRLGYGRNRRLVCAALTELTSAVGVDIAADKMLAKQLLADAGIPVADGVAGGQRRGGRPGPGRARAARGDQAAGRQPGPVRDRRRTHAARGRSPRSTRPARPARR